MHKKIGKKKNQKTNKQKMFNCFALTYLNFGEIGTLAD